MTQLRLVTARMPDVTEVDVAMMERALMLARRAADAGEVPVGAVVYRGTEVIAEASNTREFQRDPCGHAELLAIREAARTLGDWRLSDCSLVVTLEPCPMCAGAIVNSRVGRVLYGATDPKAGACESLYRITSDERLNHRPVMYSGLMADRCAEVLREFFRKLRKERREQRRSA